MTPEAILQLSAAQLARAIREKHVSCVAAMEAALARMKAVHPRLNCLIRSDDEPPVMRDGSHALRQWPKCQLCPVGPNANSAMFSTPNWIEPAASSRSSAVAVEGAGRSRTILEPQLETTPRR